MFKKLFCLFFVAVYVSNEVNAQIPIPQVGSCATSPIQTDFDANKVSI